MSFADFLTPKDTEEIKPGLFIKRKLKMFNDRSEYKYTRVFPAAWNGKIIWKNFLFGGSYSHLLWFAIIMFMAYTYNVDINKIENAGVDLILNRSWYIQFCSQAKGTDILFSGACNNLTISKDDLKIINEVPDYNFTKYFDSPTIK